MTPEQDRLVADHLNLVDYALRSMPWTRSHHDRDGQLVIDALFFAGQRQCELAEAFGVTEARISQLRCEAVRKLRAAVLPQLTAAA